MVLYTDGACWFRAARSRVARGRHTARDSDKCSARGLMDVLHYESNVALHHLPSTHRFHSVGPSSGGGKTSATGSSLCAQTV